MRRRAVVEELAALGAAVHTCSRKEAELGERLKEWEAKSFRVTVSVCDLSVRDQREHLVGEVAERFGGKLDILVSGTNCSLASISLPFSRPNLYVRNVGCSTTVPVIQASTSYPQNCSVLYPVLQFKQY
jgi:hypothetical protein